MKEWQIIDKHLKSKGWEFQEEYTHPSKNSKLQYTKREGSCLRLLNMFVNENDQVFSIQQGSKYITRKMIKKELRMIKIRSILQLEEERT